MCAVNRGGRPEGCLNDGESPAPRAGNDLQVEGAGEKHKACRRADSRPSAPRPQHHPLVTPPLPFRLHSHPGLVSPLLLAPAGAYFSSTTARITPQYLPRCHWALRLKATSGYVHPAQACSMAPLARRTKHQFLGLRGPQALTILPASFPGPGHSLLYSVLHVIVLKHPLLLKRCSLIPLLLRMDLVTPF